MSRTWFITGTSSGFGRLMTEKLLERGDRVAATARNTNALSDLNDRYGDLLWIAGLDVTDTAAVRDVVARAFADLGRIDVIVNNAGYGLFGAAEELSDQQILDQINTNLVGPIQVTRAVLPHLREQGGGRIIQLSTYGGQATNPGASLYNASKFGVEGFMESLAVRERFAPGPPRDPSRRRLEVEQALQVAHVDFRFTSGLREIGSSSDTERSISP